VIIKILLVVILLAVVMYFLQNRNTTRLRAGFKLAFLAFTVFAVAAILRPDLVTAAAHFVGVGRGTDLLLYGFVLAFVFFVISIYLKFKDYEQRITKLARHIAIAEAQLRDRK
jgi:hypothetical protein